MLGAEMSFDKHPHLAVAESGVVFECNVNKMTEYMHISVALYSVGV